MFELSPQSVRITAERKQKRPPRHSTAASFHGVPVSSIAFYDTLTVEHPELDAPMEFSIHDPSHCALVSPSDLLPYAASTLRDMKSRNPAGRVMC